MKQFFSLTLLGLAVAQTAAAQQEPTYLGDEVVVTATRTPLPLREQLNDVTVITAQDIAEAGQSTLAELLQAQPGIEISSNGGPGQPASVYIRGANSNHTLVLVDGLRLGSATTGTTALEAIPLDQIQRIEILRGPGSSLYGSDAIGGVIQIFTKSGQGRPHFNLSAGVGTYGTRSVSGGYGGQVGDTRFNLQLGHSDTHGFSAIGNPANPAYNPDGDGYRDNNLSARVSHAIGAGHEVGLTLFNSTGEAHYDASWPSPPSFDYRTEHTVSAYGVYSKDRFLPGWQSLLRAGAGTDDYTNIMSATASSNFRTDQNQAAWQNDIDLGGGLLTLGLEWLRQEVSGDSSYAVQQRDVRSWLAGYQRRFGKHSVQLNLRSDDNSQYGARNTGSLAYGYQISPVWQASVSAGTAFKAPTFNDLYYPLTYGSVGNPDLRPERSRNRELALRYDDGVQRFGVVYYDNRVTDLISWQLYAPYSYTPVNVGQASLKGTTLSYGGSLGDYRLHASLDLQDPVDASTGLLLPRRAKRHGAVGLDRSIGPWQFGGEVVFSDARYDDAANKNRLAGYGLVDLTASYRLSSDLSVNARVNNLFDKKYELAKDYNTPGTDVFVALRYEPR